MKKDSAQEKTLSKPKRDAGGDCAGRTGSALIKPIRPNESIDMIQWRVNACSQRCTRGHEREGRIDVDGPALADVMDYLDELEKAILPNDQDHEPRAGSGA